ncbi:MAG TPA: glycoside hydrolase family 3 N-terminal domain-containing protein, partial [Mycobacteriales bacterium]|nr:glycoside hydrolase family 3 N-terminal domain-containing protein [Mycobacteriales bacterium]
ATSLSGADEPTAAVPVLPSATPTAEPVALAVEPAVPVAPAYDPGDPVSWPNRQLAAQLVFSCVQTTDLGTAVAHARAGLGGIVVMGRPTDGAALATALAGVGAAAPDGIAPMVASDEEGGRVQRLRDLLGPLPSAEVMGGWPDDRIEQTAHDYAVRMRELGVQMALSPVADLSAPGFYPAETQRAFSADPHRVAAASVAWSSGLDRGGVVSAVKHWPGHGHAVDSHTAAPVVPPLPALEGNDLLPFDAVLEAGASVVMVGHLQSEGLTEPGVPATLSPNALRVLRERAGPGTVILTDSVSMEASSAALGIAPSEAALRALQAGADWAMSCVDPLAAVDAVQAALDDGRLPRDGAVASARRVLAVKSPLGLLAVPPATAPPVGGLQAAELVGDDVVLRGRAADPDGPGPVRVRVQVDGAVVAEVPADDAFTATVRAAPGAQVCATALNTGPGQSAPLGCVRRPERAGPHRG